MLELGDAYIDFPSLAKLNQSLSHEWYPKPKE